MNGERFKSVFLKNDAYVLWSLGVFLVAFVLRLIHISVIFPTPHSDEYTYWALAMGRAEMFTLQAPGYPFLLKILIALSTPYSYFFFRFVNVILSALTVVVTAEIARGFYGRRCALLAGVLAALYRPFILSCGLLLTETLTTFLLAVIFLCLARLLERLTARWIGLLALAMIWVLHVRGNAISLLPLIPAVALIPPLPRAQRIKRLLILAGTMLAIFGATLPVSYLTSQKAGRVCFTAETGHYNLLIGHNRLAYGGWVNAEGLRGDDGDPLKFIRKYPGVELFWLTPQKIRLLFEEQTFHYGTVRNDLLSIPLGNTLYLFLPSIAHILIPALIGFLVACRRHGPGAWLLGLGFVSYLAMFVVFFAQGRLRLPVDFSLIVWCAVLLDEIGVGLRTRLGQAVLVVYLAAALMGSGLNLLRFSGANLAPNAAFTETDSQGAPLGFSKTEGMRVKPGQPGILAGVSRSNAPSVLETSVPVNPGRSPYMLFEFKCRCRSETGLHAFDEREKGIKFQVLATDAKGGWLAPPTASTYYVVNGIRPKWVRVWHRIWLPPGTDKISFTILSDLDGEFEIKDVSLRGWGH